MKHTRERPRQMVGRSQTNGRVKDKLSDGFRQIIGWVLSQSTKIGGRCHDEFGLEIPGESVGVGEAAVLTNLLHRKLGMLMNQAHSIVQAHLSDEGGKPLVVAALGKGGTDAFLRETRALNKCLALKIRVEIQFLALDEVAEIGEEVGIGTS